MKLSDECATFTLNTISLQYNLEPNNAEFNNINMQNILGDMYNKYNKFVLVCTSIGAGEKTSGIDGIAQIVQFKISGLSFSNAGYNNSGASASPVFLVSTLLPKYTYNYSVNNVRVCFYKPSPIINLKIVAESITTQQPTTYKTTFILYQFNIFGLYD